MQSLRESFRRFWAWLDESPRRMTKDTYRVGDEPERGPWRPGDDVSDRSLSGGFIGGIGGADGGDGV